MNKMKVKEKIILFSIIGKVSRFRFCFLVQLFCWLLFASEDFCNIKKVWGFNFQCTFYYIDNSFSLFVLNYYFELRPKILEIAIFSTKKTNELPERNLLFFNFTTFLKCKGILYSFPKGAIFHLLNNRFVWLFLFSKAENEHKAKEKLDFYFLPIVRPFEKWLFEFHFRYSFCTCDKGTDCKHFERLFSSCPRQIVAVGKLSNAKHS